MNVRALEALHALVQGGGIASAATQLHRTQPQVSRLLTQLEQEVGFPVLRKEGRRLILTQEGHEFYRRTIALLEQKDALAAFAEDVRLQRPQRLKVMVAAHMVEAFVIDAVIAAHAQRPQLSVSLNARMPLMPQSTLAGEPFDMVIAQLPIDDYPPLEIVELVTLEMVAIAPRGHRFGERNSITASDFSDEPYVSLPPRSILRGRSDQALGALKHRPHYQFEASFATMTCQLVAGHCGVSLTDPLTALAHADRGIVIRRFQPSVPLRYGLAVPIGLQRTEVSRFFEHVLRQVLAEKIERLEALVGGPMVAPR